MTIKKILSITVIVAFLVIIVGALYYRATLSVETTDEIYGVAAILSILQGAKPFYTSWFQTGWCLVAPFYAIFLAFNNGSPEGITLFSRILYIVATVLIVCYMAIKTAKSRKNIAYIALVGCVTYVPFSIFQLGYNHFTVYLLCNGVFILSFLCAKSTKKSVFTDILFAA